MLCLCFLHQGHQFEQHAEEYHFDNKGFHDSATDYDSSTFDDIEAYFKGHKGGKGKTRDYKVTTGVLLLLVFFYFH